MRSFKDAQSRAWQVEISIGDARRVKAELGIDLMDAVIGDTAVQLAENPMSVFDVMEVLLRKQYGERNMTLEDLADIFTGDTLRAANDAFIEALIDFFPNPEYREVLRKTIEKGRMISTRQSRKLIESLEDPTLIERTEAILRGETTGNSSGNIRAPSASTPIPSPSGSSSSCTTDASASTSN